MALLQVQTPFQQFFDLEGDPLDNGSIYIGSVNMDPITYPIPVFWDSVGSIPAAQPIKTSNGYAVRNGTPSRFYVDAADFSITVKDSRDRVVFTALNATALANAANITFIQSGAGAQGRPLQDKVRESVSLADFAGADNTGVGLNDTAGASAEAVSDIIFVPPGTWRFSTPLIHGYKAEFYGPGVLKYDNAEFFRRGGSSGSILVPERYTLFYRYVDQAQVSVQFNGSSQVLTWIDFNTVEAPGSLITDVVRINIADGTLPLGPSPQFVRAYNMIAGGADLIDPGMSSDLIPIGSFNAAFGPRAMAAIRFGINNTAVGALACLDTLDNINNTGVGFLALYRNRADNNTAVGSIAGEWIVGGSGNSMLGAESGGKIVGGTFNTAVGYQAFGESQEGDFNVAVGHRAFGNSGLNNPEQSVAVGAFSGDFAYGANNTFVGYRAGTGPNGGAAGTDNTYMGFFAGRNTSGGSRNAAVGVGALAELIGGDENVAVGYGALNLLTAQGSAVAVGHQALMNATVGGQTALGFKALLALTTGIDNTAVGHLALTSNATANGNTAVGEAALQLATGTSNTAVGARSLNAQTSGTNNTAMGFESGRFNTGSNHALIGFRAGRGITTGTDNTALGSDALQFEDTGATNTAVGRRALRLKQDGTNQTGFSNCSGLGADAAVSASNQIQLGNSATTTFVYGTVQNRSDARDKADMRESSLGLDFILGLRPVEGRWDMREDYFEDIEVVDERGDVHLERRLLPKDGSKVRQRFHQWFIAQEVKALCDSLGVDFGGYQDHKIEGGCDVLSLGYDEFIPPIVKAIQDIHAEMSSIKDRLAALEGGSQ